SWPSSSPFAAASPCGRSVLRGAGRFFHPPAQAQRTHVGPDFLDVLQALRLEPALADVVPAERIVAMRRPDRILLLVIHDHFVDRVVFLLVVVHGSALSYRDVIGCSAPRGPSA